ncbi:MAG: MarR family transcriptional regulator [Steroidobacteraceae bacterium]
MSTKNLFELMQDDLARDDHYMRLWLTLLGCFTSVERTLRRRLKSRFNATLPRFDVMTALAQHGEGLTMTQLARRLMVTKGNVTGVVRGLELDQLIKRSASRNDRRVQYVTLTPQGRAAWKEMKSAYRAAVEEVLASLSRTDAAALARSLRQAQDRIDQSPAVLE